MTNDNKHIKQQQNPKPDALDMVSKTYIDWDKSKEQVWAELEKRIDASEIPDNARVIFLPWMKIAVAASFIILIGISTIMRFYTKTIRIPAGQHSSIYLPDRSKVQINAQSTVSYKPLWWKFSRSVEFEGEAYFDVQPGKKFEVISGQGKTMVLGTSFNIYSRNNEYMVTCLSGKVKVTGTKSNQELLLDPGQRAELSPDGKLEIQSDVNTTQIISWLENRFSFTSTNLSEVFEEICRQYNVIISVPEDIDYIYTGAFNKDTSVENALNLICKPFDLEFIQQAENQYVISKRN